MLLKNFCKVISLMPNTACTTSSVVGNGPSLIDNSNTSRSYNSSYTQNSWGYPTQSSATGTSTGNWYYMYPNMKCSTYSSSTSSQAFCCSGILLGTGTTTPTFNDYQMESVITTLDNSGGYSINYDRATGLFRYVVTVVNNGSSDVTFSEIGLAIGKIPSSSGAVSPNYILLTRDVLPSPVTVEAGATKTITLTINQFEFSTGYNVV